jgi:hypothetical protein
MTKALLLFALATTLVAQQEPGVGAGGGRGLPEGPIMAQIYQMRVNRIQQSLGLPEDRAKILAERWARWDREFIDRAKQLGQLRQQFNQTLLGPGSEDEKSARLRPLLDQFMALRQQQEDAKRRFETDILQPLTPAQQARMILLVEDLQSRIRQTLRESRVGAGRP